MMWHEYGLWNFSWIGMVLFWAFVVGLGLLVFWVLAGNNRRTVSESKESQPLEVLKMRLVTGEISVKDYQDIRRELNQAGK